MHTTRRSDQTEELADDLSVDRPTDRLVGSDRVLGVLTELAAHPSGIGLEGFAQQDGRGHYVLGDEFVRMAFAHHEARPDHLRIQPVLELLSGRYGETVHYAVLDGRTVVYRAKVDPPTGAIRLPSVVGGRNPTHATAVGKLLLAHQLPDAAAVRAWIGAAVLERRTEHTLTTVADLDAELKRARAPGYAV